jgi:hypothetical protein
MSSKNRVWDSTSHAYWQRVTAIAGGSQRSVALSGVHASTSISFAEHVLVEHVHPG